MGRPIKIALAAPAKVNLSLTLRGVRSDGLHLLESFVVPVSLYDRIHIELERVGSFHDPLDLAVECDSTDVPADSTNLAHRAATRFFTALARSARVRISLRKSIPVGSGLGGGSSDAASVLLGLNTLLDCPFDVRRLAALAIELGADVPVFIYGWPAVVTGIGEIVAPVCLRNPLHMVLCSDRTFLSTKRVFAEVDPTLTSTATPSNISAFARGTIAAREFVVNDLENAAARVHPGIISLKKKLFVVGAGAAVMTGSGSTVVGVFSDLQTAHAASQKLLKEGLWARTVHGLARPMMDGLDGR